MNVMMNTIVVLWHHRLILIVLLVAFCVVAISAGRRMHRSAILEHVTEKQFQLNLEMTRYSGAEPPPVLLSSLGEDDVGLVHRLRESQGLVHVGFPECRRAPARSIVGPEPDPLICEVQIPPEKPSDIICESRIGPYRHRLAQRFLHGAHSVCLMTLWSMEQGEWSLNSAAVGPMKDDPVLSGSSELNEDAYSSLTGR
jgi:hypothetical protein